MMGYLGVGKNGRIDPVSFLQAVQAHFFFCADAFVFLHRSVLMQTHEAKYAAKDICPRGVVDDDLPWINIDPKESHFFLRAEDTGNLRRYHQKPAQAQRFANNRWSEDPKDSDSRSGISTLWSLERWGGRESYFQYSGSLDQMQP